VEAPFFIDDYTARFVFIQLGDYETEGQLSHGKSNRQLGMVRKAGWATRVGREVKKKKMIAGKDRVF
jgi:hypothetical protein